MALDAGISAFPVEASHPNASERHLGASEHSDAPAATLILICSCGAAQIPAPEGSTAETRFTCRRCCAGLPGGATLPSVEHGRTR
jgi:hypothetical protein